MRKCARDGGAADRIAPWDLLRVSCLGASSSSICLGIAVPACALCERRPISVLVYHALQHCSQWSARNFRSTRQREETP